MKFTKKKDDAPKEAKKERKKKKRSDGKGMENAKAWLAQNGEKLALGAFVVISLLIVYSGFKKEGLAVGKSPTDLDSEIKKAAAHLDKTNWDDIRPERYPEQDRFDEQATLDTATVDVSMYAMKVPFHPVLEKQAKLRKVPTILAAQELEVTSGYGPIALKDPNPSSNRGNREVVDENARGLTSNLNKRFANTAGNSIIKPAYFSVVMGIVPIKDQLTIFNETFIDALEFNSSRDFPKYVAVLLRRREVGTNEWKDIDTITAAQDSKLNWQIDREDPVHSKYKHEDSPGLVMPMPTIVGRDLSTLVKHSKTKTTEEVDEEERIKDDRDRRNDSSETESFFTEKKSKTEMSENISEAEQQFDRLKSDFLFFRYFDLDVEPGKTYEYQAKLLLENPNDPKRDSAPLETSLDVTVIEKRHADRDNPIKNVLSSDWSQSSDAVVIPVGGNVLASQAVAAKRIKGTAITLEDPTAEVLAIAWDPQSSMEIPKTFKITRGSFLNDAAKEIEAVDPQKQQIVKLNDYTFKTDALIVDIIGGDKIRAGREVIVSPSMILVMGPDGELDFQHEIENISKLQSNIIPPDPRQEEEEAMNRNRDDETEEGGRRKRGRRGRGRGGRDRNRERDPE